MVTNNIPIEKCVRQYFPEFHEYFGAKFPKPCKSHRRSNRLEKLRGGKASRPWTRDSVKMRQQQPLASACSICKPESKESISASPSSSFIFKESGQKAPAVGLNSGRRRARKQVGPWIYFRAFLLLFNCLFCCSMECQAPCTTEGNRS